MGWLLVTKTVQSSFNNKMQQKNLGKELGGKNIKWTCKNHIGIYIINHL